MKKIYILVVLLALLSVNLLAQKDIERQFRGYTNPDELVTLAASLPFTEAVDLLNKVSESSSGRRIVSSVESTDPIGIELVNMHYDKALRVIVQMKGYQLDEKPDMTIIRGKDAIIDRPLDTYASVDSREIKISAVFFEMDVNEARQRGVDWKVIFSKSNVSIGSMLGVEEKDDENTIKPPEFNVSGTATNFDVGHGWTGNAQAILKFFEDENLGEIISSPNVTVRDRKEGRIQVGADVSIKQRDIAGNLIEQFYPTGTIIEVTPYIYTEDGLDYILLDLLVEKSSYVQGEITSIIRKTNASTQVLMLNGEETVIGGLFTNEETVNRQGIPILKDLPWWVFGIRYLAGSDTKVYTKKELVILIKTEILPTLKDRLTARPVKNKLEDEVKKQRDKLRSYEFGKVTSDKK